MFLNMEGIMRKNVIILFSLLTVLIFTNTAFALLENNGNGTITQTRNDGSMLMWLQDANYANTTGYDDALYGYDTNGTMTWDDAMAWIGTLNTNNYLGYNDWRLPDTKPVNGNTFDYTYSYDGSTDGGYNVSAPGTIYEGSTGSEMAYLYYVELRNIGLFDTAGNQNPSGGLSNTGPFENVWPHSYWSRTVISTSPTYSPKWTFHFGYGDQHGFEGHCCTAWAVRSAGVVPEPISSILFATGGILLAGQRFMKRRNKA